MPDRIDHLTMNILQSFVSCMNCTIYHQGQALEDKHHHNQDHQGHQDHKESQENVEIEEGHQNDQACEHHVDNNSKADKTGVASRGLDIGSQQKYDMCKINT
eukprot:15328855-Ditylum_brightwellii.AAC.1